MIDAFVEIITNFVSIIAALVGGFFNAVLTATAG
jgi:hypothetical protein